LRRLVLVFVATVGVIGGGSSGTLMSATLSGTTASALAIAFWRNLLAAGILAGPALAVDGSQLGRLPRRALRWSVVSGTLLAVHFICYIASLTFTSVAASMALVCLQPAWVALLTLLRGERLGRSVPVGLVVAFAGVLTITGVDLGSSSRALTGDLLALVGGMLGALYTMAGGRARRQLRIGIFGTMCYATCAATVAAIAVMSSQPLLGFGANGWAGILAITFAAQLLGHTSMNYLVRPLGPLTVTMLVLVQIPVGALLAAMALGEVLPGTVYLGLACILVGLAVVVIRPSPRMVSQREVSTIGVRRAPRHSVDGG